MSNKANAFPVNTKSVRLQSGDSGEEIVCNEPELLKDTMSVSDLPKDAAGVIGGDHKRDDSLEDDYSQPVRESAVAEPSGAIPKTSDEDAIDIVCIQNLDSNPPDAWTYTDEYGKVKRLTDMLESRFGPCVWVFNWPARLVQHIAQVPDPIEETARFILLGLQKSRVGCEDRPIVFITSRLGGIVLMQALVMAEGGSIAKATRSVIFLSPPFRNPAFLDAAVETEPGIKAWSSADDQEISRALENIKKSTGVEDLVPKFTDLHKYYRYHVSIFHGNNDRNYILVNDEIEEILQEIRHDQEWN